MGTPVQRKEAELLNVWKLGGTPIKLLFTNYPIQDITNYYKVSVWSVKCFKLGNKV